MYLEMLYNFSTPNVYVTAFLHNNMFWLKKKFNKFFHTVFKFWSVC